MFWSCCGPCTILEFFSTGNNNNNKDLECRCIGYIIPQLSSVFRMCIGYTQPTTGKGFEDTRRIH